MENEAIKTRKNMDYSKSAVNLTNPPEIGAMLANLNATKKLLNEYQEQSSAAIPQIIKDGITRYTKAVADLNLEITEAIDARGSFQNTEIGFYALKQRKATKAYNAAAFEHEYPQYAPAVIIKAVDIVKLNGLIKGGLLDEENLKNPDVGVIEEKESFVYIIKV